MSSTTIQQEKGNLSYMVLACFVAALGGLLFGYDTAVISGANEALKAHFNLTPAMLGFAAASALVGCIIGAPIAGPLSDRFGRRNALIIAGACFLISAIWTAIPRTLPTFVIFRMVGGVGVGIASMVSPMYISEISPTRIRGRMVSMNQIAIVSGMLVVYFVNYFIARQGDEVWLNNIGWRWMFGSEAIPVLLFMALLFLVPESPRWLVKKGRSSQALDILTHVNGRRQAEAEMAEITGTIAHESDSLLDILRGRMLFVVLIGLVLATLQQVTGINVFLYYAPTIFKQLGTGMDTALLQTIAVGATMVLFTIIAVWKVDTFGRKPLMIIGYVGMGICLFATGMVFYGTGSGGDQQLPATWVLIFTLGYIACFSLSVGPVTWVILSEIYPTKVRGRAMAIATFCLWTANYFVSWTFPMMTDNEQLQAQYHGAFPFWIYGAFCVIGFLFVWKFIPETKGRSLEEIEKMWLKK